MESSGLGDGGHASCSRARTGSVGSALRSVERRGSAQFQLAAAKASAVPVSDWQRTLGLQGRPGTGRLCTSLGDHFQLGIQR